MPAATARLTLERSGAESLASPMPAGSTIVVIDDTEDDLTLAQLLLRKACEWPQIVAFRDDDSAIEYLTTVASEALPSLPLVTFVDAMMPGLNGFEVLEWIRAHPAFDRMAVVMWSASDMPGDIARAAHLKAQCYVWKFPTIVLMRQIVAAAEQYAASGDGPGAWFPIAANLMLGREGLPNVTQRGT